jgi:hypothetical protein
VPLFGLQAKDFCDAILLRINHQPLSDILDGFGLLFYPGKLHWAVMDVRPTVSSLDGPMPIKYCS